MPSSPEPVLRLGPLEAQFRPASGGRLARLRHDEYGDILVPLPEGVFDPWDWPKAGAFPLFPFHGRLPGAAFRHVGERFEVRPHPAAGSDAVHGPAQRCAWAVTARGPTTLDLVLEHVPDADWPFAFRARQSFRLRTDGIEIGLELRNTDERSMPGGIGWHPYFPCGPDAEVLCDARLRWPLGADAMPGPPPETVPAGAPLLRDATGTAHGSDWALAAVVTARHRVEITATGLPHIVVHRTAAYACLEPVSHLAGALAVPERRRPRLGMKSVAPGAPLEGTVVLTIRDRAGTIAT